MKKSRIKANMRKRRKQGKHMYNQQIQSKAADFEHQSLKLQTDYQNSFVCLIKIRTLSKQFELV